MKWMTNWFNPNSDLLQSLDFKKMKVEWEEDPLAEKRRAAIEWLGERWILHPKNGVGKQEVREAVLNR